MTPDQLQLAIRLALHTTESVRVSADDSSIMLATTDVNQPSAVTIESATLTKGLLAQLRIDWEIPNHL